MSAPLARAHRARTRSTPLRIAFLLDTFPQVSETFILHQITTLLELGHGVDIYSQRRPAAAAPVHPEFSNGRLAERVTYVDERIPAPSALWELPVRPVTGTTWVPGSEHPISNLRRVAAAVPTAVRAFVRAPSAARSALDERRHGYQAASLSALYRLDVLAGRRGRYDVAHAHFGPTANTFGFARLLWDTPFVVTFHGYDFTSFPASQSRDVYLHLFATVDRVTVSTEYARRSLVALGCPDERLVTLPQGVPVEQFQPSRTRALQPPLRVLTVARLVPVKGIAHGIEAVATARMAGVVIRYDVVGEGPLREELSELARRLGVADIVRFWGAQPADVVRDLFAQAHVFMLPSVEADGQQEGQGLVLQEAQASGVPVVSTRSGGIPDGVLDGVTGFLAPAADPAALADRLAVLARDPDLRVRMGEAGRRFVEAHFDLRTQTRRLVDVYRDALCEQRGAG